MQERSTSLFWHDYRRAPMRWAKMRVGFGLIEELLRGSWPDKQCKHTTAPADLKVIAIEPAAPPCDEYFFAVMESKAFEVVPEGAPIPEIYPFTYETEP